MERKIFEALNFNLAKPLPIHFLRRFAKAAGPLGDRQYMAAKYFMELASIDYEMTKYNPSQVRKENSNLFKIFSNKTFDYHRSLPRHCACPSTSSIQSKATKTCGHQLFNITQLTHRRS